MPRVGIRFEHAQSLDDLAKELAACAANDARFEHAVAVATELQGELRRLGGLVAPRVRARRPPRRPRRSRDTTRLLQALSFERQELERALEDAGEHGVKLSNAQLADLRLGERTRRVFHEAGLTLVQDVTSVTPEQALQIPHLAPASLAEVRAAVFLALEAAGGRAQSALPPPGSEGDVFEGFVRGVNLLPPQEREILVLRHGVEDRVHTPEEVARILGCTPEFVLHLEERARNTLLTQPGAVEACWRLEDMCARLGLAWDDQRLDTFLATSYPQTRVSYTRLVAWLALEKARVSAEAADRPFSPPTGIAHFDAMVVAALGRYGDLRAEQLTTHVQAALTPSDRTQYPQISVADRVRVLGPAIASDNGTFRLPDAPIPGLDDRHIRALNGLIGALQRLGSARISSLTGEINRRLPRDYQVTEQYVRAWLTQHPELFTQSEQERFKLASFNVDILCGLDTGWRTSDAAVSVGSPRSGSALDQRRERIGAEIEAFLREHGPQSIARIRSHLYGRVIGQASADAIVANDRRQRFVRLEKGLIGLRTVTASANDREQ